MSARKFHEAFDRPDEVRIGSDRNFGLVFSGVFLIIALLKYWHGHHQWALVFLALSIAMTTITLAAPRSLNPFNKAWFQVGLLLHKIVSPVIMGLLFFAVVTPVGLVLRVRGKRPLNLAFESKASTYWVARTPPGPKPATFQNQF